MQQVFVIHGGEVFVSYDEFLHHLINQELDFERLFQRGWKDRLSEELGKNFEVVAPRMPNPTNARYNEWKIWFDKFIPHMRPDIIMIGHSLGGIFLAKYLSENDLPVDVRATMLVASPFGYTDFDLPESIDKFAAQAGRIFLYHSKDDPVVSFTELAKYQRALPNATARVFEDRGHFNQEQLPELVEDIKSLSTL